MASNAPPSDSEISPYTLNSSPLAHNNPHNVRVVSQSQQCLPSQLQNIFSPYGQIEAWNETPPRDRSKTALNTSHNK